MKSSFTNISLCFYLYSDSTGIASVSSIRLLSAGRSLRRSDRRIVWSSWERNELFSRRHLSSNLLNSPLASLICENKDKNKFEKNQNTMQHLILHIKSSTIFNNNPYLNIFYHIKLVVFSILINTCFLGMFDTVTMYAVLTPSRLFLLTASRHKKQSAATSEESSSSSMRESSCRSITDPPQPAQAWTLKKPVLEIWSYFTDKR